jgi:hypothetical protein
MGRQRISYHSAFANSSGYVIKIFFSQSGSRLDSTDEIPLLANSFAVSRTKWFSPALLA